MEVSIQSEVETEALVTVAHVGKYYQELVHEWIGLGR